jgi:DNA polymerase III alpha subunit
LPDIDIDFLDRTKVLDIIKHVPAAIQDKDGTFKKHNTGVYCTSVPYNPLTGIASIDYKTAEQRGYFKIDFLNVSAYQGIRDEVHLTSLLNTEPVWDLLYEKEVCDHLFHINGYHDLLRDLKPCSIEQLATVLALIRPGKKHLIPICKNQGFQAIQDEIWTKTDDSYFFKKSHAVSYACVILVQLNLICEQVNHSYS